KKFSNLIRTKAEWNKLIEQTKNLEGKVIQNVDFKQDNIDWAEFKIKGANFLACDFRKEDAIYLIRKGAFVYPKFTKFPYNPHRLELYSWQELMDSASETI